VILTAVAAAAVTRVLGRLGRAVGSWSEPGSTGRAPVEAASGSSSDASSDADPPDATLAPAAPLGPGAP
jgi:hypothetical protein